MIRSRHLEAVLSLAALVSMVPGCSDSFTGGSQDARPFPDLECSIPTGQIFDGGVGVDGIPSLSNPEFVRADQPGASYLDETPGFPDPRVIGIVVDGQPYAVPHNILWWHEIVNLDFPNGLQIAVTYCPLTGSSLVFDRGRIDGSELGVSGLIFQNNMIMFDRETRSSLFSQMKRGARCGQMDGMQLEMSPVVEMRWSGWKALHPSTLVVGEDIEIERNYRRYPYGSYEENRELLFPQTVPGLGEEERPMKERVLGIPSLSEGDYGGLAVPFGELALASEEGVAAVNADSPQGEILVLWDDEAKGAVAFRPRTVDATRVTIRTEDGRFVDEETASEWTVDGRAVSGAMAGGFLEPVPDSYVAFWFAWRAFQPGTEIWTR